MLPFALLFLGGSLVQLVICAYYTSGFMRAYDRRWNYVAGLRRGRLVEIWQAVRTPLAEPVLERRRRASTRFLPVALGEFCLGVAMLALALASGQ